MFKLVVLSAFVAVAVAKPGVVAPVVAQTYITPAAVSHTYREDIIKKPAVVAYSAPIVAEQVGPAIAKTVVDAPLVVDPFVAKAPTAVITKPEVAAEPVAAKSIEVPAPVVAEPVAPVVVKAAPAATVVATPIEAKTIIAPAAVSHTYREDIINKPATIAYAAPAVAYTAPVVYSAPVAYAAPAAYAYAPAVQAW